ncbi:MAG: phosphoadenosine phosphosulfate reductase family protein [Pseudomonadota bacterium]
MSVTRHVLGLSGGKDSAALAVYMRDHAPDTPVEYFFTDTGQELPEVYEYLERLEAYLGKEVVRLNAHRDFDYWLREYKNFLPSAQQRWCTRKLKLEPFEAWVKPSLAAGDKVVSYVAIRSDENRIGYRGDTTGIDVRFPFQDADIDKAGVIRILKDAGLGLPRYYDWRSRSGCTFCFFQQKIEWARLKEQHPEAFEAAKAYEKTAVDCGSPFTWTENESLEELERPERIAQIETQHEERVRRHLQRKRRDIRRNPFKADLSDAEIDELHDLDEVYGVADVSGSCVICHK